MTMPSSHASGAWRFLGASATVLGLIVHAGAAHGQANPYRRVAVLQAPADVVQIVPADVFAKGQVAGLTQVKTGETTRYYFDGLRIVAAKEAVRRSDATIWRADGVAITLPALARGVDARVWSMNSSGVAAGESKTYLDRTNSVAVVWRDGKVVDLGAGARSSARHINESGLVLGRRALTSSVLSDGEFFVGKDKATLKWLKPLPPGANSLFCVGLTDAGQVVCRTFGTEGGVSRTKAHVWSNGVFSEIVSPEGGEVLAMAVSPSGIVAGYVNMPGGGTRGFTWQAGQWRWLPDPPLPAPVLWSVYDVNDRGEVLLYGYTMYGYNGTTFLWNGLNHVPLNDLVVDSAPGETIGSSRLGPRGELLVNFQWKVDGALRFKDAVYAP
ncbi:hypothetical protein EYS42_00710 [Aquabacterium lacunae]|uniref:WD40 repeat domain-containing protein n=1 Tax=Aquabacterium lacunae TaxID=2528630 RepID=A0A4Q9H1H4_9BURK|nr:hypothetical protein [Aquabacterium lacunae]TBO34009.1 hypothetical protein EYS42_00710 [Aquabacterium lacunae]